VSRWTPCKRRDFIQRLRLWPVRPTGWKRQLGFDGPFIGTRHQFMAYQKHRLTIPSNSEYSVPQLRMMIREAEDILEHEITLAEWNQL